MINPAAILALLSDLYAQINSLQAEKDGLQQLLQSVAAAPPQAPAPAAAPSTVDPALTGDLDALYRQS